MKKTITLLFALSALSAQGATNLAFSGSADPENPIMISTAYGEGRTEVDGWLASYGREGIDDTDYSPAYVGVDANTAFKAMQIILSSSLGGPRADLDFTFQQGSSLELSSSSCLSYNSKADSAVAFNFHLANDATSANMILNGGIIFDLTTTSTVKKRNLSFGKGLNVKSNAAVKITGAEGSKFTMNGNWQTTTGGTSFIGLDADIGGSYSSAGTLGVTGASNIVVAEGASFSFASNATFADTSKLILNGSFSAKDITFDRNDTNNTYTSITLGDNATINANSLYMRSGSADLNINGNSKIIINNTSELKYRALLTVAGNVNVAENAELSIKTNINTEKPAKIYYKLTVDGKLNVEGGTYIAISRHGAIINSTGNVIKTNILLGEKDITSEATGGKLVVNASNDFSEATLMTASHQGKQSNTSYLELADNVSLKLNGIAFSEMSTADTLQITFGKGSTLILNEFIDADVLSGFNTLGTDDKIVINGFAENTFGIKNHIDSDDSLLSQISASGVDQFYWVKDNVANVWWLSAVAPAVPEPAEWAMILGSLALGFTIYRRRK